MIPIEAQNLHKKYAAVQALNGVDLSVEKGEIHGIIGPDGAGKTTLFRILTTLILADEGQARVAGLDVVTQATAIRERIGYMPGRFSLYLDLTVEENLHFFATLFHTTIQENYDLIRDIYQQIEPFKRRRAGALSGGMKQKLALSCALIHKPEVLFLDEPTTGVDPVSRKEFWNMLKRLAQQGITILVSTPYMDEAGLCDRISLMKDGRFMVTDSPANIVRQYEGDLFSVQSDKPYSLLKELRQYPGVGGCFAFGDNHHLSCSKNGLDIGQLERHLIETGHTGIRIQPIVPTIEDCFMKLAAD